MTTNILSKDEEKTEGEFCDYGGFALLGEGGSKSVAAAVLYVPEGFRPEDHLRPALHRYADHARYLLHLIHVRSIFDKRTKSGWVALKADYLRRFLPWRKYKLILDDLEGAGVIETKRDRAGRRRVAGGKALENSIDTRQRFKGALPAAMSRKTASSAGNLLNGGMTSQIGQHRVPFAAISGNSSSWYEWTTKRQSVVWKTWGYLPRRWPIALTRWFMSRIRIGGSPPTPTAESIIMSVASSGNCGSFLP